MVKLEMDFETVDWTVELMLHRVSFPFLPIVFECCLLKSVVFLAPSLSDFLAIRSSTAQTDQNIFDGIMQLRYLQ